MLDVVIITDSFFYEAGVKSVFLPFQMDGYEINFVVKSELSFLKELRDSKRSLKFEASVIFADKKTYPLLKGTMSSRNRDVQVFAPDTAISDINTYLYYQQLPSPCLVEFHKLPGLLSKIEATVLRYSAKGYSVSRTATILQKKRKYVSQVRLRAFRKLNITNHSVMAGYSSIWAAG